jgi:hypothetical protein
MGLQLTYIAGEHGCAYCCVILVTRHVIFIVPLPRAGPPYCLRRHTLLLHGCLATVVNKRHIAYSMHVTLSFGVVKAPMQVLQRAKSRTVDMIGRGWLPRNFIVRYFHQARGRCLLHSIPLLCFIQSQLPLRLTANCEIYMKASTTRSMSLTWRWQL